MEWDAGPPATIGALFDQAPFAEFSAQPDRFRLEWGPIFYRGRTDGSARILLIGQDPADDENIARRILVGTAGQRVQGLLHKLGIIRSYVMVNAMLFSIYGQFDTEMKRFVDRPAISAWRNQVLDALGGPNIKAIVALGSAAGHVLDTWPGLPAFSAGGGKTFKLLHPTARPLSEVRANWSGKLAAIASSVAPDPDGVRNLSKYAGSTFTPAELARIPSRDLSFGTPEWLGDGDHAKRIAINGALPSVTKKINTILVVPRAVSA